MKIGLPGFRVSRKLLVVTLGVTVLLGGTGMTALYIGGRELLMKDGTSAIGGECIDVQTMVLKTPSDHLWLRRYIRMDNAGGPERVRTALRIAGLLAQKHAVDLIHVSVLDVRGPDKRAFMRERAIGAEVLIALKPDNLPEMKSPAMASYYEGPVSSEGRFYGDKVIVDIDEIGSMMTAMRTVKDKPDCIIPVKEGDEAPKENAQGARDKKDGKPKKNDHAAKPGVSHDGPPENDHGDGPATEGDAEMSDVSESGRQPPFLDGLLSLVGFGASDEPVQQDDQPTAEDRAGLSKPKSDEHAEAAMPVGD